MVVELELNQNTRLESEFTVSRIEIEMNHNYSFICQAPWKCNSTDTNQKLMHTDLYIEIWTRTKEVLGSDAFSCKKKEQMTLGET